MRRFRAIWISDLHLGTRGAKAELLLDFLDATESDTLYLVGDIVDGWKLKRSWYWPQAHNDVIQRVLAKARAGTAVIYLPGNHDEGFRDYLGLEFGRVRIVDELIHTAADGRTYLVLHGDRFDVVVNHARWLALIGEQAYRLAMALNLVFNFVRRRLGFSYWSLSAYLKRKVKNAVEFVGNFETALTEEARRRGVDGIICGHIHHAQLRQLDGIIYANDGDWVESCTALVEHPTGELEILKWTPTSRTLPLKVAA